MQGGEEGAAHSLPAMTAVKPGQFRSTSVRLSRQLGFWRTCLWFQNLTPKEGQAPGQGWDSFKDNNLLSGPRPKAISRLPPRSQQ